MIKGTTKTGFEYEIEDAALDDWDLIAELAELDEGNLLPLFSVAKRLLNGDQMKALREHCRDAESGRVKASAMFVEIEDMLNSKKETKN